MRQSWMALLTAGFCVLGVCGPAPTRIASGQRAVDAKYLRDRMVQVMQAAREAIGGEAALNAVKSLSVEGKCDVEPERGRHVFSDLRIDVLLPDRFLIDRFVPMSFFRLVGGFSGDQLLERRQTAGKWTDVGYGDGGKEAARRQLAARRREFMRYLVCWLLTAPGQYGVQFNYVGEAENGDAPRADVIEARGADDLFVRLFFDQASHRLVIVTYQEPPIPSVASPLFTRIEGPATDAETKMVFRDYRRVDGILLPYRVDVDGDGMLEQWRISSFKVNAPVDPKRFEKQ